LARRGKSRKKREIAFKKEYRRHVGEEGVKKKNVKIKEKIKI